MIKGFQVPKAFYWKPWHSVLLGVLLLGPAAIATENSVEQPLAAPADRSSDDQAHRFKVSPEQQQWWAFQPIGDPVPPTVKNTMWPRNEIDRFILAELELRDMRPAAATRRRRWIRRVTFDLTGLPPTPEDVQAFLNDATADAQTRVADRLLASTSYGQRWARHWLDVVRYADFHDADPAKRTASCEITEAWRYRDWVVRALNHDLPFDQFVVHQIAGDLLPIPDGREFYEDGLVATTFLTNGVWDRGDADKEKIVSDMADDQIDTIGKAFLGLTLGCARCHDHKYDPISQEDYYALAGIFHSCHMLADLGTKGGEYKVNRTPLAPSAVVARYNEAFKKVQQVENELKELDKQSPVPAKDDPQRLALIAKVDQLKEELPPAPPLAMAMQEGGTPGGLFPGIQDVPLHIRGSYTKLGPVIPRRLPHFFAGASQPSITSGSGRRELAAWIASRNNHLTPRVIVNRVWQWHLGEGLVRTPNNFGMLSQPPTHPALLDWLATRFVRDGWSLKKLHRRIVLSATYGQASSVSRKQVLRDQENRWLGRFSARRLEAEVIRDAMLFVGGQLDLEQGGPAGDDLTIARRSLYVQTARWNRSNFATLFDAANPDASVEKRAVSIVAPQVLMLLNHDFSLAQARHLARRLRNGSFPDDRARLQYAYQLLFGRLPSNEETAIGRKVLSNSNQPGSLEAWQDLAHVLLCGNEFVYLD